MRIGSRPANRRPLAAIRRRDRRVRCPPKRLITSPTVSWLNLLTPSAAVIAIFLAIALVIQSFRHGRQIRRIEQQIASAGLTAYDPTLERLKALSGLSEKQGTQPAAAGGRRQPIASRRTQIIVAAVVGGPDRRGRRVGGLLAQRLLVRQEDHHIGQSRHQATPGPAPRPAPPHDDHPGGVASAPPPPRSPARRRSRSRSITAAAYRAPPATSSVPKLTSVGYSLGTIGNAPNGEANAAVSSVQYVTKSDLDAACSVATALGVAPAHVTALTLMPAVPGRNAGVVVLVGRDLASG